MVRAKFSEERGSSIVFFGIGILSMVLLLGGCDGETHQAEAPQRPVPLATVAGRESTSIRELLGRVEQTTVSPLAFEVDGRVVDILIREGESVKAGALIARLDPEPYQLQVRKAQAQLTLLRRELDRKQLLLADQIISQAEYDRLATQTETAQVELEQAQRKLRKTKLKAPFAGRLAQREIENQQVIQAGMPAFYLEDDQRIDVSVGLPAPLAQRLPLNASLTARARLANDSDVELQLHYREHQTRSSRGEGVYQLILSGDKQLGIRLYPGMAVHVFLEVPKARTAVLSVPVEALMATEGGQYRLWRYEPDSGTVNALPVDVITLDKNNAEVSLSEQADSGGSRAVLSVGDSVVVGGLNALSDGQQVSHWVRQ